MLWSSVGIIRVGLGTYVSRAYVGGKGCIGLREAYRSLSNYRYSA